ncbi:DNA topoisomerase IV [Candidatus Riesia sp. GBBU]|nr:DNA topoisomerase IV [Candidatus Riesia sp. GBBU]
MSYRNYDAKSIEILSGLDPIRLRPGMYTDTSIPNHLAQEVIDNSIDEVLAGYAKNIDVILHKDQSIEVVDDGRGIPIDVHPKNNISAVELIFGELHTGGKFSNKNYKFSGGLHGVGISVVNALSKRVEVIIKRNSNIYKITFVNGKKETELKIIGKCKKFSTGTGIRFWPDSCFFDNPKFSVSKLSKFLKSKSVLCSSVSIHFVDKINNFQKTWKYKNGLSEYLSEAMNGFIILPNKTFFGNFIRKFGEINWAICWLPNGEKPITESYVNLIPTTQGGTHVNGLRQGLLEAIREFCSYRNLCAKRIKINREDIWENCSYILSLKIENPQFVGQIKEKLSSKTITISVYKIIKESFTLWLNHNLKEAERITDMIISNAQKRIRARKKIIKKKLISYHSLPGKLSDCISKDLDFTELFLVEGDSAGGSAKQARDRKYQAIMPLKGKILNTWEISSEDVLFSQEVHDISVAIGINPTNAKLNNLRYGKICILSDADSDGLHISTLLCGLFFRHFTSLIKTGRVYIAMPPLYRIDFNKKIYYALNEKEKISILNKLRHKKSNISIQRFKGLGEMNPIQLRETTLDPKTRRLVQLTINEKNYQNTINLMDMLLSKKRIIDRRNWLYSKGNEIEITV